MQLQGSSALITGGASGLGAATARRFAEKGAKVVVADLKESAPGDAIHHVQTDVTDESSVSRAIATVIERHGALHILVHCAGLAAAEKILTREGPQELAHFAKIVQVNLVGTFNCLRLAAAARAGDPGPPAGEDDRGVIVNTASIAAYDGQIGQSAYAASKAGVAGLTLPAARELARENIRVVSIAPGIFDTPMLAGLPEKARNALSEVVPHPRRLGTPEEYAALAEHIVENGYINGETIRLDGALRMAPK